MLQSTLHETGFYVDFRDFISLHACWMKKLSTILYLHYRLYNVCIDKVHLIRLLPSHKCFLQIVMNFAKIYVLDLYMILSLKKKSNNFK